MTESWGGVGDARKLSVFPVLIEGVQCHVNCHVSGTAFCPKALVAEWTVPN